MLYGAIAMIPVLVVVVFVSILVVAYKTTTSIVPVEEELGLDGLS